MLSMMMLAIVLSFLSIIRFDNGLCSTNSVLVK